MDKKNNMKQAMYEMFGVGTASEQAASPAPKEQASGQPAHPIFKAETKVSVQPTKIEPGKEPVSLNDPRPKAAASYLAPGTVMEGTLRSVGDVEIAGDFKGDITTEGTVILHSNIQGNLSVSSLNLSGCKLVGDVVAGDAVTVSKDSEICGNITAKELQCAGRITGDLKISANTALAETAQINGNINTGSISVDRGAMIKGSIETNTMKVPDKAAKAISSKSN